jgi:hypothetical protein
LAFGVAALSAAFGQPARRDAECFRQLVEGSGSDIVCELPTRLTERERDDLRAVTRDPGFDVTCKVSVRIARKLVEDAVRATGPHVFAAPPQPVACDIVTKAGKIPIKAQFAPRIVFDNGKAIDGSPELQRVAGASSAIAWPVIQYVNRSGVTRQTMLKVINALKEQYGAKLTGRR